VHKSIVVKVGCVNGIVPYNALTLSDPFVPCPTATPKEYKCEKVLARRTFVRRKEGEDSSSTSSDDRRGKGKAPPPPPPPPKPKKEPVSFRMGVPKKERDPPAD
jgi:hypothetical protein